MVGIDPERHGFRLLQGFQFDGIVDVFEWANHAAVDGQPDFLRLNVYLSQDRQFVTLWWGLLEPILAEARFTELVRRHELRFHEMYRETLFRGYVSTDGDIEVILRTTQVTTGRRFTSPQVLTGAPDNLNCDVLAAVAGQASA